MSLVLCMCTLREELMREVMWQEEYERQAELSDI